MNLDPTISAFLQYGSFGLIAFGLIWLVWKGAPNLASVAMSKHEATIKEITESNQIAITKLVDTFKEEAKECRDERMAVAAQAAAEREKDRAARHEATAVIQQLVHRLEKGIP